MPLKILPKKNWHVLKRENVERVRKDEAEAKRIETETQDRVQLAEQEARSSLLRKRARERSEGSDGLEVDDTLPEVQLSAVKNEGSKELEKEKLEERERQEKRIGILTYLGQSALDKDKKSSVPWYSQPAASSSSVEATNKRLQQKKGAMDPLLAMARAQQRLSQLGREQDRGPSSAVLSAPHSSRREDVKCSRSESETTTSVQKRPKLSCPVPSREVDSQGQGQDRGEKREGRKGGTGKAHKKDKHKKHKEARGPSIEELRKERVKREREARTKSDHLLRRAAA